MGSGGTSSSDFLCLQAEKISDLELRLASFGLYRMKNFSVMHKMHFFVTGLKEGRLVLRNFQVSFGFSPAVFWFRKWVDRVVLFSGEGFSILDVCLLYLALKSLASPTTN